VKTPISWTRQPDGSYEGGPFRLEPNFTSYWRRMSYDFTPNGDGPGFVCVGSGRPNSWSITDCRWTEDDINGRFDPEQARTLGTAKRRAESLLVVNSPNTFREGGEDV